MPSKTPNFDKALDEILRDLKPHFKICSQCGQKFEIFEEDIEFYKMLKVPPPKLCPDCRKQRRMGFMNYTKLYRRKCNAPDHKEYIISSFSEANPLKIYDFQYWWSDNWDPMDYQRQYDFNRSFFEQFDKLNLDVPHTDNKSAQSTNSDYCIGGIQLKDCYYNFGGAVAEGLIYCFSSMCSKDCLDCNEACYSELCYETNYSDKCYNCYFCHYCSNCLDSYFLFNCQNCSNCFLCWNIRNKSYCFLNQQLSKEEYQDKIRKIYLGHREILDEYKERFNKAFKNQAIHRSVRNYRAINSLGDLLRECNKCFWSFQVFKGENLRHAFWVNDSRDITDSFGSWHSERVYESLIILENNADIKFSFLIRNNCLNLEYCIACHNCSHCFACIGLRNKSYCILNKQYTKDEYYKILDQIKTKMLNEGEYGEFFPLSMSLYPYNDTYAMIEFPLTKEEVKKRGWQWHDEPKIPVDLQGLELVQAKDLPKNIKDVDDDILSKAIVCEITKKPFRIIKKELEFYRKHNLPIPTKHPYQRMLERFQKRNPSRLWKTVCAHCSKEIYTSYPPEKQKELKIYCDECYKREVE